MDIHFENHNENLDEAILKLESCKFRSENIINKPSCCSSSTISGFLCHKKNIFPVSFSVDCKDCMDFISAIQPTNYPD